MTQQLRHDSGMTQHLRHSSGMAQHPRHDLATEACLECPDAACHLHCVGRKARGSEQVKGLCRWEELPGQMGEARGSLAVTAAPDGIYALGGYNLAGHNQAGLRSGEVLDPAMKLWRPLPDMHCERHSLCAVTLQSEVRAAQLACAAMHAQHAKGKARRHGNACNCNRNDESQSSISASVQVTIRRCQQFRVQRCSRF